MVNKALPIHALQGEIVAAVGNHPVVIITTETGAGKSTQVPQYLLRAGYDMLVTQPRRLPARTVAERVAEEYGTSLGDVVGYRTAYEHQDSKATRCLFVTDGLALVRELMGAEQRSVLIIDEVHEWNLNIEVLVAWARREIKAGATFKLVLMSATLEAERLSAYFDGAPIINAPGRTFPVEERAPKGRGPHEDAADLLREGRNVLMFFPGKGEIQAAMTHFSKLKLNAEILPLHGELSPEEQNRCFRTYGRPKCVVSTNVAQTSVTIPDIDAVVDSGMERRIELVDGIEGLYLKPISLADAAQRKGRAGRTKAGIYIDWCQASKRLEYPKAEILRVRLDQTVLRLAVAGINMEELKFFHQPDLDKIHEARRALVALGCMDASGKVTPIGHRVSKMPISVKYGRMIVEAEKLGVVDDIITIAAILEQGGINARVCQKCQQYELKRCDCWKLLVAGENTSDAMAQLLAYQACDSMSKPEIRASGIFVKAYMQAKEVRKHLVRELRKFIDTFQSSGKREDILRAVAAGMVDHLYRNQENTFWNGDNTSRELARESVVPRHTQWLVGEPFDLEIKDRFDITRTLSLIRMVTAVNPKWLAEIAPQLVTIREGIEPRYDQDQDEVVSTTQTWFNGQIIEEKVVLDPTHRDAPQIRRDGRNQQQWEMWTDRPLISLPDLSKDDATIPEITVCTYGSDVTTEEPLKAYGVVAEYKPAHGYRYSTDPWFEVVWLRDEAEAERQRRGAIRYLNEIRHEAKAQTARQQQEMQRQQLKRQAEPLRVVVRELVDTHYSALPSELRSELYSYTSVMRITDESSFRLWVEEARGVIARTKEALAEINELKTTALELRNKVNDLLVEHKSSFSDDAYDELVRFDINDDELPRSKSELESWISDATEAIAEAERVLSFKTDQGVSDDALAALKGRFGSR